MGGSVRVGRRLPASRMQVHQRLAAAAVAQEVGGAPADRAGCGDSNQTAASPRIPDGAHHQRPGVDDFWVRLTVAELEERHPQGNRRVGSGAR